MMDTKYRALLAACKQALRICSMAALHENISHDAIAVFNQLAAAIAKAEPNHAGDQPDEPSDGKIPVVQPHRSPPAGALPAGE